MDIDEKKIRVICIFLCVLIARRIPSLSEQSAPGSRNTSGEPEGSPSAWEVKYVTHESFQVKDAYPQGRQGLI